MDMEIDPDSRDFKVALWIVGALEALKGLKIIIGGVYTITPKGVSEFDQLDAEFKPTNAEIAETLPGIVLASGNEDEEMTSMEYIQIMIRLVIDYRDDRHVLIAAAETQMITSTERAIYESVNDITDSDDGDMEEPRDIEVHKVTILVVDCDGLGAQGVKDEFENTPYANHCMNPEVKEVETQMITYTDSHPINSTVKADAEYEKLFPEKRTVVPLESVAIILHPDGDCELALPRTGNDDDLVPYHMMLGTAMYHYFSELGPKQRTEMVQQFIKDHPTTGRLSNGGIGDRKG